MAGDEDSTAEARMSKPRYRWVPERSCWVLCEGFSPVLHKAVL